MTIGDFWQLEIIEINANSVQVKKNSPTGTELGSTKYIFYVNNINFICSNRSRIIA